MTLKQLTEMEEDALCEMLKLRNVYLEYPPHDSKYLRQFQIARENWLNACVNLENEQSVQSRMAQKWPALPEIKPLEMPKHFPSPDEREAVLDAVFKPLNDDL